MGWPKGKKRGVEQGNSVEPSEDQAPMAEPVGAVPLEEWVEWCEAAKEAVVVGITHPDVLADGHRDGKYSGFLISKGPQGAKWSDGSALPER